MGGAAIFRHRDGRVVLVELEQHGGKVWLHVSLSSRGKTPTWQELGEVKAAFVGAHRKAIQVLPAAEEHFSIWEVLHLWHCAGRDPLPDFRRFDPSLGVAGL